MKLIKNNEIFHIESIIMLLYGEPGVGKTSLACTSNSPLLLDFDNGAHRSHFRKDVLRITSWADIANNFDKFIEICKAYKTIIIDTVDTALDYAGAYLIMQEPRLSKNKLQYFGRLREEFALFLNRLKTLNVDILLIAHVKEKDEGDVRIKRPQIAGGTYDRIIQMSDIVGYSSYRNGHRVLDFSPSEFFISKDSCGLNELIIPDFTVEGNFLANLISKIKIEISALNEEQRLILQKIEHIRKTLSENQSIEAFNEVTKLLLDEREIVKKQIWKIMNKIAKENGYEFDANTKEWYKHGKCN